MILKWFQSRRGSWGILAAALSIALAGAWFTRHEVVRMGHERFRVQVREIKSDLENRVKVYEQVLRGCQGLFAASENVTREEWRVYIDKLNVQKNYPGIQGVGFAICIDPADLADHIESIR